MNISTSVSGGEINLSIDMAAAMAAAGEAVADAARGMCPVDTGRLQASIASSASDSGAVISANTEYAAYVEFGTSKMAAQPYLVPALLNSAGEIAQIIASQIGGML